MSGKRYGPEEAINKLREADMVMKRMSQPYRASAAQQAAEAPAEPNEDADSAAYKSAAETYDIG